MKARISKYHASGNDMIVVDPRRLQMPLTLRLIRLLCDRHFGVGADGICFGPLPDHPHPRAMRFFNPDGSQAEKSGNGLRIFARYLWDNRLVTDTDFDIAIGTEVVSARIMDQADNTVCLGLGKLEFGPVEEEMTFGGRTVRVTVASIGNPHAVVFTSQLQQIHTLGPIIECDPRFPERTNVQFVSVVATDTIQIEIWERGAGYTLASGTSCSAAAGAAVKTGRCRSPVSVQMAGGAARVVIGEDWQVELEGPVFHVFEATLSPELQNAQ